MPQIVRALICSVFVASVILAGTAEESVGRESSHPASFSSEGESTFDQARDRLFPRPLLDHNRFVMVLRFLPSFHPPVQIVLTYGIDSEARVEYRTLRRPLQEVVPPYEGGTRTFVLPNAEELARQTGLKQAELAVKPEQVKNWLQELLDSLAASSPLLRRRTLERDGTEEIVVQLDGTVYTLDLKTPRDDLFLSFSGSEIDTAGPAPKDVPVVNWMNSVRQEITKMLGGQKQK